MWSTIDGITVQECISTIRNLPPTHSAPIYAFCCNVLLVSKQSQQQGPCTKQLKRRDATASAYLQADCDDEHYGIDPYAKDMREENLWEKKARTEIAVPMGELCGNQATRDGI